MSYVDGFLLPIKKDNLEEYRKISENAGKVWMEHGALAYKECVLDDSPIEGMADFNKYSGAKKDETTIMAFIIYKSREDRDIINEKVMKDPRIKCDPNNMPFDVSKMAYAGFKTLVDM